MVLSGSSIEYIASSEDDWLMFVARVNLFRCFDARNRSSSVNYTLLKVSNSICLFKKATISSCFDRRSLPLSIIRLRFLSKQQDLVPRSPFLLWLPNSHVSKVNLRRESPMLIAF